MKAFFLLLFFITPLYATSQEIPSRYTERLDFVQIAPDQGESGTCLYVGSTGAMELIANKKHGITQPQPYGPYDLSESFVIHAPKGEIRGKNFLEIPVLRFNAGFGIHLSQWDYATWDGHSRKNVWGYRNWKSMERVPLPQVETIPLFMYGNRWSTRVLDDSHIQMIKENLVNHRSPVLVNYNDNGYWHVILIVGFDDDLPGTCYDEDMSLEECNEDNRGSFYVRDSFGIPVEVRNYEWFRTKGNAAVVVKEKSL